MLTDAFSLLNKDQNSPMLLLGTKELLKTPQLLNTSEKIDIPPNLGEKTSAFLDYFLFKIIK